jgi:hypothetical protein
VNRKKTVRAAKPKAAISKLATAPVKASKPSFWTRLFGGKTKEKVSLVDAKMTK